MRSPVDRGEGAAGYLAVILLIAVVVGTLVTTGIPGQVVAGIRGGVCEVSQGEECENGKRPRESATEAAGDGLPRSHNPRPVTRDEWGHRSTDGLRRPPDPTEDERRRGEEVAGQVRGHLNDPWYKPWTWFDDDPPDPRDALSRMSPGELNALFGELSDDEIRRLLDMDGVPEILKVRADQYLLRRLEQIEPHSIEPEAPDGITHDYVVHPLFMKPDPELTDIAQGGVGDCWWLAGMGALAHTDKGREALKGMITENANGTYTVRFPDGESVTVTSSIAVKKDGEIAYARVSRGMWPAILEKALAQKKGGYEKLDGGRAGEAMEILTGKPSSNHDPEDVTRTDLERWLKEGKAVAVSTKHKLFVRGKRIYEDGTLVTSHVYVVEGFTDDGKVMLYNPWGAAHAELSMKEFGNHLWDVDVNDIR
ncbi:hypothetical protein GCM10023085_27190 [Actinomadura viridis]|uniref:Calpain catalytic domain-containing protein n=1 Tax=Actinomadura viridis TaxID=58110 RepID=A0A931DED6_9ACTN|nr:C2 family cysteine protease [Actinomadura viridis]MBG6087294.1 hypothetical protein [Actinomadura viridis]